MNYLMGNSVSYRTPERKVAAKEIYLAPKVLLVGLTHSATTYAVFKGSLRNGMTGCSNTGHIAAIGLCEVYRSKLQICSA